MQYNVENSDYAVEFTDVNMDVAVTGQAEINVAVGDAARIDVGEALNYIKTGTAEIEAVAQEKTAAFNLNAISKTNAFNDNYTAKKALIDAEVANAAASATAAYNSATDAEASATAADNSAKDAKQWAIGDPGEPTGNSAKYWADQAATTLSSKANVDLSNLSATGEAKFVKSVTTGSTNGTISVDGSDVAVYGLGSAAYTASTAYATAAQGALADTALQPNDNISLLTNNAGYITSASIATLTDVNLTSLASGQTLVYDSVNSKWVNSVIGGAVDSVNGYTGTVVLAPSDLGITEYTAAEVETLWGSI